MDALITFCLISTVVVSASSTVPRMSGGVGGADGSRLGSSLAPRGTSRDSLAPRRSLLGPTAPFLYNGTYTIKNVGNKCRPFASVSADSSDNSITTGFEDDGSGRQIFNLQTPTNSLPGSNDYTIAVSGGRDPSARDLWSTQDCGGSEQPDLYYDQEDGSGRQIFTLEPVPSAPGQFHIIARRRFRGTPYSCNAYLSAASAPLCSGYPTPGPSISYAPGDDGSGLQRWTFTSTAPPQGSNVHLGAPMLAASGTYILSDVGGTLCEHFASVQGACAAARLVKGSEPVSYQIQQAARGGIYTISKKVAPECGPLYFTSSTQGCTNAVSLAPGGSPGVNQLWRIIPIPTDPALKQYYIVAVEHPVGCPAYLTLPECYNPAVDATLLNRTAYTEVYNTLRWSITPAQDSPAPPSPPPLASGQYRIVMNARPACENQLNGPTCSYERGQPNFPVLRTEVVDAGVWNVVEATANPVTYYVAKNIGPNLPAGCASLAAYLTKAAFTCDSSSLDFVNFKGSPDAAGASHWTLTGVPGKPNTFTVQSALAPTCSSGSFLSIQACRTDGSVNDVVPDLFLVDDNSGRQQWSFYPA